MSTSTADLETSFESARNVRRKPARTRKYIYREETSARVKRILKKTFRFCLIAFLAAAVVTVGGFYYFYNHYAAIVEQRVKSGFWHSRAGIYSAPFVLRKNQKTSPANVADLLRRAGYVEGDSAEDVWNGSFKVAGNRLEITTNDPGHQTKSSAGIKFAGNRIVEISDGQSDLEEFRIEPEMLTGRTATKRGKAGVLRYEEIPENLKNAIITAEDRRFFEHYGIDPRGIARAFLKNFGERTIRQGGSTITQQLVKNTFLSPEKSYSRKFSEMFLALALENMMSKEEIFALYCNEIYLGQYGSSGVHGVEQAARAYFDKNLADLTLEESAAIAAMIKNPNRLAPHKNEAESVKRRQWIISKMNEAGFVSGAEAESASQVPLKIAKPKPNDKTIAPYFVDAATSELAEKFQRDYLNTNFNTRVYTTIDTQLQNLAEKSVADHLSRLDKIYGKKGLRPQAVIVAINPQNGQILAMVGGRDYRESQFNRATEAMRQPGSTFKPFVYATALERGMTPLTLHADRPTEFNTFGRALYKPANYGDSYSMTNITMKTALAKSSNVVAVKTAFDTGLRNIAAKAEEFGFENIAPYASIALGTMEASPLQLAAAYAVFANGGRRVEPTFIDKIVSAEDDTVYKHEPGEKQIINEKTAYMITDMLEAVVERGTARSVSGALGKDVVFAGKTGSSKDGWFVGYTPNLVTVAWVGLDDNRDLKMTGGEIALPLWTDFMKAVVGARPEFGGENFPMPKGLTQVTIDPETGMLADSYCPQSERVVVPVSAISNIRCLKHQPLPETFVAAVAVNPEFTPTTLVIEPASEGIVTTEVKSEDSERNYKEINGLPTTEEKITKKPGENPREPVKTVKEGYYDDYLKQTGRDS